MGARKHYDDIILHHQTGYIGLDITAIRGAARVTREE
jgi:hypothetical protein